MTTGSSQSPLPFQLIEPGLSQKFGHAFESIEMARLINQGGHFVPAGQWSPTIIDGITDDRQMNAEGNIGIFCEQMHGVYGPGTGNHQGCRTDHTFLERAKDSCIGGVTHPKIVGVYDQ